MGIYEPMHAKEQVKQMPFFFLILKSFFLAVLIAVVFNMMFGIAFVKGTSMTPSLYDRDIVVVSKVFIKYEIGDIILIKTGERNGYIKRICGLPGDTIEINDDSGTFFVNGQKQKDPYIIYEKTYSKASSVSFPLTLGKDEYFVMGDHRSDSRDSRNYGPVGRSQLGGKVLFVLRGGLLKE